MKMTLGHKREKEKRLKYFLQYAVYMPSVYTGQRIPKMFDQNRRIERWSEIILTLQLGNGISETVQGEGPRGPRPLPSSPPTFFVNKSTKLSTFPRHIAIVGVKTP